MSAYTGCEIFVAAASDLAPLARHLQTAIANCRVQLTFGSSGALARQIENGAPFDVFLSASSVYTDRLLKMGKAKCPTPYAKGRVAIWSRTGLRNPKEARSIAIANPQFAPYGQAAKQYLERTSQWKDVEGRIVYAENVRQTMQFAETGNVEMAITSWTLAKGRNGILLDDKWHDPITQVAVQLTPGGATFVKWLSSTAAHQLFATYGLK